MEQFSISFRLGKPSAPHGANLSHNNREFSAANIDPARSEQKIFFTAESSEDASANYLTKRSKHTMQGKTVPPAASMITIRTLQMENVKNLSMK